MSDPVIYTKGVVYWNGAQLSQETKVGIKRASGSQAVDTVANGYSGESPGSPRVEITVDSAVPSADFELNPGPFIQTLKSGELTVFAAGRTLTSKGSIIDDNFSHSVNEKSSLSFNFRGQWADWV